MEQARWYPRRSSTAFVFGGDDLVCGQPDAFHAPAQFARSTEDPFDLRGSSLRNGMKSELHAIDRFAVQAAMVLLGAFFQPVVKPRRNVLDREISHGTKMVPKWFSSLQCRKRLPRRRDVLRVSLSRR